MYKRKLFYFGLTTAFILSIALGSTAITAYLTKSNLEQSNIAQTLLVEHEKLSSNSYRLFKQLTDEIIFGEYANQAYVRKKQNLIDESIQTIRTLELQQRQEMGLEYTQGSVEDTDELVSLISSIIDEFQAITLSDNRLPLNQQEQLRSLLEVTIDERFREAINAAVTRQARVVTAINTKITTLNSTIFWVSIGLAILSFPLIIYGCYWLFHQLYQPLALIGSAANTIAAGNYSQPIHVKLDDEFETLASSINQLAERLRQHDALEEKSRKRLEVEVEQRTMELTEANLQLTKVDARRRQFIADVSHELRTPLTIIRGEAQVTLRLKSATVDDYQETLSSILHQSVNLSRLVDDLLLLTRAEMNQLSLERRPIDIKALVQEQITKWSKSHPARQMGLSDTIDAESVVVSVDPRRVQQVLSILIDNAFKYSDESQPVVLALFNQGNTVGISVTDHGEGISAAEVENVFERFVRFSKHHEGLGLGLPIAKAIIEQHGGAIEVESTLGRGTTFTVLLPNEGTV
ncbi:sensor histidine kinase [Alteromonas oceanisediminis]|uniref:sensor histidine kinase n=1 Tax=Alteromonas oceanisediminis TaxID=2836180 RepID=UPI001BDA0B93|nr:HAMP domain-containing sensor histidine kinase [Alteromonas oceanisediminis]MBT0587087.1 HAMP domain-containing histidine kinase [Alteromonas oceanisediminis]